MSCPDRIELLLGIEEDDPGIRKHLAECARCREIAASEQALIDALVRLRDPAPPASLLAGVLARVEAMDAERALSRRQLAFALALSSALIAVLLAVFWRSLLTDAATTALHVVSAARVALGAFEGTLGAWLGRVAAALLAVEVLAALSLSLLLHRLVAAVRVRS